MARRVDTQPYVAIWLGNVSGLKGLRGELSAHRRPELAIKACKRQRDAIASLFGAFAPWFIYQVIDARDGRVVTCIY